MVRSWGLLCLQTFAGSTDRKSYAADLKDARVNRRDILPLRFRRVSLRRGPFACVAVPSPLLATKGCAWITTWSGYINEAALGWVAMTLLALTVIAYIAMPPLH